MQNRAKLLFFCCLLLTSCNTNSETTTESQQNADTQSIAVERHEVELNKDNLSYYVNVSFDYFNTTGNYRETYTCTLSGVLSYAFYDNVVVTLNYDIVGKGEPGSYSYPTTTHQAKVDVKLNAAGGGYVALPYDYVPSNAVPAIEQTNLSGFNRSLSVASVAGKVIYII